MTSCSFKANFAVELRYEPFYTGGQIQISENGENLLCQSETCVQVIQIETGKAVKAVGQENDDEVTCFCLSPDDQILVIAGRSLILRQWDWSTFQLTRSWKAIHTAPVLCMGYDSTSTLLATGGADSSIKVWDVIQQYCTHNLLGHTGVVSVVKFHPDPSRLQLFTAAEDYKIRLWDLTTSLCTAVLDSHYSRITSLQLGAGASMLYSAGRDNIVTVWNLGTLSKEKTIPVYEAVEGLLLLPEGACEPLSVTPDDVHFVTGGSKGVLRVWNSRTAQCVYTQQSGANNDQEEEENVNEHSRPVITNLLYNKAMGAICSVMHNHNIMFYKLGDFSLMKQFAGYNEDILDIKYLGLESSHIAVATNSELITVFELSTRSCQILSGHTDIVMALDVHKKGKLMVSGSKDNTVRVWQIDATSGRVGCVAVGQGHTHAVGAVSLSRLSTSFMVSGSQDLTIKVWTLPGEYDTDSLEVLHARATERAHDKDINSITVSPNDKLIASGSQDKTAKLWNASDLSLVGVLRGHKRGIWCVQFSPVDQCLATASADTTVKLWALTDFSCVKTFEGHGSSVLRVNFITRGMQLVSSGSDGLLKLWTIKSNECVKTFDEHEDKVWALAVNKTETSIVTGGGDSNIVFWKDTTELELEESLQKQEKIILKEQKLMNLLHEKKYLKAISLAITLEQPYRMLHILKEIMGDTLSGREELEQTLGRLRDDQIDTILRFAVSWNTNSKHCHVAQFVISLVLKNYTPEQLCKFPNFKSSLEGLLPYTERHFQRTTRLSQQATFVDYTWQCMKLINHESALPADQITNNREQRQSVRLNDSKDGTNSGDEDLENTRGRTVSAALPGLSSGSESESGESGQNSQHLERNILSKERSTTDDFESRTMDMNQEISKTAYTQQSDKENTFSDGVSDSKTKLDTPVASEKSKSRAHLRVVESEKKKRKAKQIPLPSHTKQKRKASGK